MQRPFIHPYAYSILILLFTTITATAVFILLLLLLYYCHCYKTVATDKLLRASLFPGAADLTNQPSKLIFILWLPLCRINKFGLYYPRRLLRSPILVGHHLHCQITCRLGLNKCHLPVHRCTDPLIRAAYSNVQDVRMKIIEWCSRACIPTCLPVAHDED